MEKQAAQTSGYEVAYSTASNFAKGTTRTMIVSKNKNTGYYADVANWQTAHHTNVCVWTGHNGENQKWKLVPYVP